MTTAPERREPAVATSRLIVVIDDDPMERELLVRILLAAGHRVVTANDGQSGLKAVADALPDLVILDVMLPRLNGYQTCQALKRDPATARCPILMLTSEDEATDRYWAAEVGASALIAKPADLPLLLKTVTDLTGAV